MKEQLDQFVQRRAQELLDRGLVAVEAGNYVTALNEFRASVFVERTAEALTYWGWMEHQLGDTERAVELCHEAIGEDPQYGNPYNDIGSYLVVLGRSDEAIGWFEKAIASECYEPRQFPHLNLAKLYLAGKQYKLALHHFEEALRYDPDDLDTQEAVLAIKKILQ